jgi:hypothetical protein
MLQFYKQFVKKQPFLIAVENCYRASRFTAIEWLVILATIFWLLKKAHFAIMFVL